MVTHWSPRLRPSALSLAGFVGAMTVAAARKQQKEVDIVLKKVEDGMEEFAHVWDQGIRALGSSGAQKEKLGEELKKSINKLQRLRVQIREWIQQTDFKGNTKDKLEEARRKIESDMTRFKEFERELKTKAFSSNALAKGDELDEADAERLRWQDWLTSTIQQLNDQRDEFEADLETLSTKKNLSSSDKERMPELREWQDRHEFHIRKMELILRALDNEALDLSDLACIKDGVEFYMESHMEPNYMHDEALYDYIDLTSFEEEKTKARTPSIDVTKETPASKEDASKKGKEKDRKKKEKEEKKDKTKEKKAVTPTPPPAGKVVTEAVITSTKQVVPAPAKEVTVTAVEKADAKAVVVEQKKPPVVRSIVDDLAEDEVKVQADQLSGDAEEFICKICQVHVVGCSPKLTNCSHLFCGDCLAQWFAQHPESQTWAQRARSAGPERVVPCPVCKQPLNEKKDLHPVCGATSRSENLLLWRMLSSLKIVCMNSCQLRKKDGRCDWVGEYGQYQKHAKACQNLPMAESGEPSPAATETVRETQAPAVSRSPVGAAPQHGTPVSRPEAAPVTPVQPATAAPSVQPSLAAQAPARSQEAASPPTPVGAPPRTAAPTVVAPRVQRSPNPPQPPQPPQPVKLQAAQTTTPSTSVPSSQSTDTSSPVAAQTGAKPAAGTSPSGAAAAAAKAPDASAASSTAEETQSGTTLVATCAFEPTGPNMVQVRPGDLILVLEKHASGWAFCKNVSAPNGSSDQQGWAPSWIAQPLQSNEDKSAAQSASQASQAQHSRAKEPETRQAAVAAAPTPQHSQGAPASQATGAAATSPAPAAATASSAAAKAPVQQQQHSHQQPQQQQSLRPAATVVPAAESASAPPASTQAPQSVVRAAVAPFSAATPSQLSLALGDLVEIVERDASGWTYGRKAQDGPRQSPVEGWFPDWCTQK